MINTRKVRIYVIPFSEFLQVFREQRVFFRFLPEGSLVASMHQHPLNGTIDITVTHPSFPYVPEGETPGRYRIRSRLVDGGVEFYQ